MKNGLHVLQLIILIFILACHLSCTSPSSVDAPFPDNRITVTVVDSLGNFTIVSSDPDDWQIHLSLQIGYVLGGRQLDPRITPAYPNPAGDSISFFFTLGKTTIPSFMIYND